MTRHGFLSYCLATSVLMPLPVLAQQAATPAPQPLAAAPEKTGENGSQSASPVAAQTSSSSPGAPVASEDIVVTARRRGESLLAVPVVVTAVSGEQLAQRGIVNLDTLAQIVPQLIVAPQGSSVQGGNISIRGISGPDTNPFGDQAVSFTIDGVQVAKANVRRMSDFDIAQVEVLKGPQALYFGKNSMAGIINIQSADPGDHLEAGAKLGYEFQAREMRAEGFISTPLADGLGLRVAGRYSTIEGYLYDQTPQTSPYYQGDRNPKSTDFGVRATLKYDALDNFDARLKVSYGEVDTNGASATTEFTSCPLGARQFSFLPGGLGDNSQCKAGDRNTNTGYGALLATIPATLNDFRSDGRGFSSQNQLLSGLVMHFRPSEELTITATTGHYRVRLKQCQNFENSFAIILPSCTPLHNGEFSQELNFNTNFSGPLNFSGGLYYSNTKATTGSYTYLFGGQFDLLAPGFGGPDTPAQVSNYRLTQKGQAYSGFVSASFKPVSQVEISAGVRYSYEKKRLTDVRSGSGISEGTDPASYKSILDDSTLLTVANNRLALDRDNWDDLSPEATINYRPTENLTFFGSYKHGFLSGGFNSGSVNFSVPDLDLSYKPQTISGFEGGAKTRLLNGDLLFNIAAYTYKISDLQVSNFTNATSTIRNAASSKVEGVESDVNYRTPLRGFSVHGAVAYNRANYTSFPGAPCYNGQTPAQGCTIGAGGNPTQSLAGKDVARAPRWNFSAGMNYDTQISTTIKAGLTAGANRTSSFLTDGTNAPLGRQPAYTLIDASVRVGGINDEWQVAFIGRNLNNTFYYASSTDVPFTGGGAGTAAGVLGDRFSSVSRGRELLLQLSHRFGK